MIFMSESLFFLHTLLFFFLFPSFFDVFSHLFLHQRSNPWDSKISWFSSRGYHTTYQICSKKNTKQSNSSIFLCTSTQDVLRPSPQGLKWCFEFHYVPHISIPIKSPLNPTKSLEHLHSITIFDVSLVLPPWFSEPGSLGQRLPAPWHWRATRWSNSLWRKKTRRRCWTWPNGWMRSSRLATATTRKYGKTSVWKWSAPPPNGNFNGNLMKMDSRVHYFQTKPHFLCHLRHLETQHGDSMVI